MDARQYVTEVVEPLFDRANANPGTVQQKQRMSSCLICAIVLATAFSLAHSRSMLTAVSKGIR